MTIEVRHMLIKSTVSAEVLPAGSPAASTQLRDAEQWKEEVLSECKAWLEEKLNELRER